MIDALVDRSGADPDQIEDVIMGCVMQAGEQSINVARNAMMASNLPESVPGTTIDRQCGSSQQALHFAAQAVMSGAMDFVIAIGVESMTRVPMGLSSQLPAKNGFGTLQEPGHREALSPHPVQPVHRRRNDGEEIQPHQGRARRISPINSHQKAIAATQGGKFEDEIVPLKITLDDGSTDIHTVDEGIRFDASLEGIKGVKLIAEKAASSPPRPPARSATAPPA